MSYEFRLQDRLSAVEPAYRPDGFDLIVDGRRVQATLQAEHEAGAYTLALDGLREHVWIAERENVLFLQWRGRVFRVEAVDALERVRREIDQATGDENISAPMPGTVIEVAVAAGQSVHTGELLMTIESMKLQTSITAPHDARVSEIYFATGQSFDRGATLVRLVRENEGPSS